MREAFKAHLFEVVNGSFHLPNAPMTISFGIKHRLTTAYHPQVRYLAFRQYANLM